MKKIIMFIALAMTLSISAESITFSGTYRLDDRKSKAEGRKGFVGGCIYSGKLSNGKLVKVYTAAVCPIQKRLKLELKVLLFVKLFVISVKMEENKST
jgi:hypothetical protein